MSKRMMRTFLNPLHRGPYTQHHIFRCPECGRSVVGREEAYLRCHEPAHGGAVEMQRFIPASTATDAKGSLDD